MGGRGWWAARRWVVRVPRPLGRALALLGMLGSLLVGFLTVAETATGLGATPGYPTITAPATAVGAPAAAIALGDFTLADSCSISSVRSVLSTNLGTVAVSGSGGATVTGSGTSSATITGTLAQVEAALDAATLTSSSAGTATVTATLRPSDTFTSSSNEYLFSTATGHYYRRYNNGSAVTWSTARTNAAALTFCNAGGYLATFTTSSENDLNLSVLRGYADTAYWAAGIRSSSSTDPQSSPSIAITSPWYWDPGSNAPSSEQAARFSYGDPGLPNALNVYATTGQLPWHTSNPSSNGPALVISPVGSPAVYKWDDVPTTQSGVSYGLVEFGNNTTYTINSASTTVTVTAVAWDVTDGEPSSASSVDLPFGSYDTTYSQDLAVTGGVGESASDWSFTVSSGSLPHGLALARTGARQARISGTPTQSGSFTFSLTAADGSASTADATQSFTLVVTRLVMPDLVFTYPFTSSPPDPYVLATHSATAGPQTIAGGSRMAMCAFLSNSDGTALTPTAGDASELRFDTGAVGAANGSVSINGATVSLTNDYVVGTFLASGVSAANLQDQFDDPESLTIWRNGGFREDFYFTVRIIPYWSGTTPTCATSNGGVVSQTVLARALGTSFTQSIPVAIS